MNTIIRGKQTGSGSHEHPARRRNAARGSVRWITVSLLISALLAISWFVFGGEGTGTTGDGVSWSTRVLGMLGWVQSQGLMAAFWLIALQALLVILVIPGPYFTLGAGFIFGLAGGAVVAVAGSVTGAAAAYGIARAARAARAIRAAHGARGRSLPNSAGPGTAGLGGFVQRLVDHPRLRMLERLILLGDWKVILSTRLIPFFPFKLSNYLFGWLRFPFAPFFWGTLFGVVPITMVSVSAGALASDLSGLADPVPLGGASWGWSLAAFGVGLVLLVWSGRRARALYRQARDAQGVADEGDPARGEAFR